MKGSLPAPVPRIAPHRFPVSSGTVRKAPDNPSKLCPDAHLTAWGGKPDASSLPFSTSQTGNADFGSDVMISTGMLPAKLTVPAALG
jgi:hypothetical protein